VISTSEPARDGKPITPNNWRDAVGYGLIVASIWAGWEIVKAPLMERAPMSLALRIAPQSPEVLRRAAEAALAANRTEDAARLSEQSLVAAPFNVRALRVRGLAEARGGDSEVADQLLTLAGNWSLRDDPAHAWLVEYRLRRGDYGSSFAHADTLARRRSDLHGQLFDLFTTAAINDPRAFPALLRLLSQDSPWRLPYIDYLLGRQDTDGLILALGVALNKSRRPLSVYESGQINRSWLTEGRFGAMRHLAASRPGGGAMVVNGDFSEPILPDALPLEWNLRTGAGLAVQVTPGVEPRSQALSAHYSGYGPAVLAEQLLLLEPGRHAFVADQLIDLPAPQTGLAWIIRCANSERILANLPLPGGSVGDTGSIRTLFDVPADCAAQWLRLEAVSSEGRTTRGVTITQVGVSRAQP